MINRKALGVITLIYVSSVIASQLERSLINSLPAVNGSCDGNIGEQLTKQGIHFSCTDDVLIVEDILNVSFQLNISNYQAINAYILFQNILSLEISVALSQFTLIQLKNQPFLSIQNVSKVTFVNILIEKQIIVEQTQSNQVIVCASVKQIEAQEIKLLENSSNYLFDRNNALIQFSSESLTIENLSIDSYDGLVEFNTEQSLSINSISIDTTLKENHQIKIDITCFTCTIQDINLIDGEISAQFLSKVFEFDVLQSIVINNINIEYPESKIVYYNFIIKNSTNESTQEVSSSFAQINQFNATGRRNKTYIEGEIGLIQISVTEIDQFTIKSGIYENIGSSNINIELKDVHTANITNIQIKKCLLLEEVITVERTTLLLISNIQIDYLSLYTINTFMQLTAVTTIQFNNLLLPYDPYIGSNEIKVRTQNPLITVLNGSLLSINNSKFNFKNLPFTFGSFYSLDQFLTSSTEFINIYSTKNSNGGCLNFGTTNNIKLRLVDSTFDTCVSQQLGGAIFGGILEKASNLIVRNCESQVGGGLFLSNQSSLLQVLNIIFLNNKAKYFQNDYIFGFLTIEIDSIYEYNENLSGTDLFFKQIKRTSKNNWEMYSGLLYVIYFKIVMNDIDKHLFNVPINLYTFCQLGNNLIQNFQQEVILNMTLPYMILYQNPANYITNQKITLKFADTFVISENFTIPEYFCNYGMELIQLLNGDFMCKYCDLYKANYDISAVAQIKNELSQPSQCQSCNSNLFDTCYANYSTLRTTYWRSQFTVNQDAIYTCSIQQSNCQGGNSTGDYLCSEGYVGPQCLDCDRRGDFWNATFGSSGTFQCKICGDQKSNTVKIIVSLILFYLIISILIYSNFKSLRNILYANYLSKMGIIYIGRSLQIQGETSVFIKTLVFNFSIYQVSNFISQNNILDLLTFIQQNPINSQFVSIDCFLVNLLPSSYSIGFVKLILCALLPIIALASIFLVLLIMKFLKRISLKMLFNIIVMTYTYLFVFSFFSLTLEYSLESIKCLQLQSNTSYLMLDLSYQCDTQTQNDSELLKIKTYGILILVIFCLISPITLFSLYFFQRNKLNKIQVLLKFGFFYREYKKRFYYWEIIRQLLKILIVGIKVCFIDSTIILVTLYSICLVGYLGIFFHCQPFISKIFNRLEVITILVAIINILASSLLRESKINSQTTSQTFSQVFYYISQAIQFIYFTYLAFLIIVSFFSNKLKRLQKYKLFTCLSEYFPLYPHRLFLNFKKIREKVNKQSYKIALYSEYMPLKSNIQMQEIIQQETIEIINE